MQDHSITASGGDGKFPQTTYSIRSYRREEHPQLQEGFAGHQRGTLGFPSFLISFGHLHPWALGLAHVASSLVSQCNECRSSGPTASAFVRRLCELAPYLGNDHHPCWLGEEYRLKQAKERTYSSTQLELGALK